MRTRQQQRANNLLTPLTPEEAKTRKNNIAHIKHLREAIKKKIEKWDEVLRKETDKLQKVWMEPEKGRLECWLEDLKMVLRATEMSPVYIPTVREEWIKAAQQKPTPILEEPEGPPKEPNKPNGPEPARKHVAKKSGAPCHKTGEKDDNKGDNSQQDPNIPLQTEELGGQPGDVLEESRNDPLPPGPDPKNSQPPSTDPLKPKPKPKNKGVKPKRPKPKNAAGTTPKGVKPNEPVPKSTAGAVPGGQTTWYKTDVIYDLKCTGEAAIPPESLLNVTRKWKVGGQPKPSTSGGPSANNRKRTTPARWLPQTQPRTTYTMGNKITPAWGVVQKGSMDLTEKWRIPIYKPPKLTEKQEAAQKEAKRRKLKYKRYRPGQLALKEVKYYKYNASFIIPISAIRRLCLEIGYDCIEKISFQLHAYRLLQEAGELYLVRVFKDTNLLAAHARRIMINTRDKVLARKVSGDYGQHNTWAWNSDNVDRPWAYTGKLTKEQRKIRTHYLERKQGYKKQSSKVKVRK